VLGAPTAAARGPAPTPAPAIGSVRIEADALTFDPAVALAGSWTIASGQGCRPFSNVELVDDAMDGYVTFATADGHGRFSRYISDDGTAGGFPNMVPIIASCTAPSGETLHLTGSYREFAGYPMKVTADVTVAPDPVIPGRKAEVAVRGCQARAVVTVALWPAHQSTAGQQWDFQYADASGTVRATVFVRNLTAGTYLLKAFCDSPNGLPVSAVTESAVGRQIHVVAGRTLPLSGADLATLALVSGLCLAAGTAAIVAGRAARRTA
jgi:hypothetical protein